MCQFCVSLSSTSTWVFDPNLIYYCTDSANWLSLTKWGMDLLFFLLWYNICREITYYVWPPGKIVLGCLDRGRYPNSATGVGKQGKKKKNKRVFPRVLLLLCYIHLCSVFFYLWCATISLGGIKMSSVYLVWHRENQDRSFSYSCVYLRGWQSDHKLPPGQRSVDWTDSLMPLHHACPAGWHFRYCQDRQGT